MPGIVYLTTSAPSKLASDLMLAGYVVWEALSVSEVLGVPLVELDVEQFSLPITTYATSYFLIARMADNFFSTVIQLLSTQTRLPRTGVLVKRLLRG